MKARISNILLLTSLLGAAGCIHNDLPYPKIPQNILAIRAAGESSPARIDSADFTVKLFLDEETDIQAVSFTEFKYSPEATCDKNLLEGTWDLSVPMTICISGYSPDTRKERYKERGLGCRQSGDEHRSRNNR